jgi:hypothetical protein
VWAGWRLPKAKPQKLRAECSEIFWKVLRRRRETARPIPSFFALPPSPRISNGFDRISSAFVFENALFRICVFYGRRGGYFGCHVFLISVKFQFVLIFTAWRNGIGVRQEMENLGTALRYERFTYTKFYSTTS